MDALRLFLYLVLMSVGLVFIAGGLFDWNLVMNNRLSRPLVQRFGRRRTRLGYILLGIVVIVVGAILLQPPA